MRVAVTGAAGRLGSALIAALADAPFTGPGGPTAWGREAFDLDAPETIGSRLDRDRPEVVVHAAAWTDVDGCARDPELALRRNAIATGILAAACAERGTDLLIISTNEVFDGSRTDGQPYLPGDRPSPGNPYGASKAEGERLAASAFAGRAGGEAGLGGSSAPGIGPAGVFGIARTAWLFGAPGRDFPSRMLDAAERARAAGEPLRAVADEWGTPTYTADVADAIVELLAEDAHAGIHHLVNGGFASRADWTRDILGRAGLAVEIVEVPLSTWERPSSPPRWGVLAPTPLPSGEPLRPWRDAMADYAPRLLRASRPGTRTGARGRA
jgi:dTDP-4-dehydrorhamnose reductase